MQILVLIGLYILKCTKFDQLIFRQIIKIVATRCQILTLKRTKIDFGWGSALDPVGRAYSAPPDPLAGFKGPTSKGRGGKGSKGEGGRGGSRHTNPHLLPAPMGASNIISRRWDPFLWSAVFRRCRRRRRLPLVHRLPPGGDL